MSENMVLSSKELNAFLDTVKPITSKRFNVPYEDWVFFDGNFAYAFNGLYFYHTPFRAPEVMALPAKRTQIFLPNKDTEIGVLLGNESVTLDSGKSQIDFAYPFRSVEDYMKSFYVEAEEITHPVQEDFAECVRFCSETIFRDNIEYSNIYVHEGNAYSTDGSRISVYPCDIPNVTLSIGIDKLVDAFGTPDTVLVSGSTVSFGIGDGILSVLQNIGYRTAVTQYIPKDEPLVNTIRIPDPSEIAKVLKKAQSFDTEFKKKDTMVTVSIGDEAEISMEGVKSRFREGVEIYASNPVTFRVHPAHFSSVLEGELWFGDVPYMKSTNSYSTRYIWVEK